MYTMAFFYKTLSVFLCPFLFSCFATIFLISLSQASQNVGVTLDLIHRHSPVSPLYDPSLTRFERLTSSFNRSLSRLQYLKLANFTSKQLQSILTPAQGEYLMKIQIGTPPIEVLAIVDTGSDLTWIQCTPCPHCYKQNAPLFDPKNSTSYRNVPCSSQQCKDFEQSCDGNPNNVCHYQVIYGDDSVSNGNLALETFGFDSTLSGRNVSFPNVAFGCGHDDRGTFFPETSGIIGLGGGALSIVRQLSNSIDHNKFSYCLTSPDSNVTSKINFGSNAIVSGPKVVSTPLVKGLFPDTYYYVTLEGFTIGKNKLKYFKKSDTSDVKVIEEGNMVIDTGTTLTILERPFYNELELLLVNAINGNRVSDPRGVEGLCYNVPRNGKFRFPPLVAHFRGADVRLRRKSVFLEAKKGVVCLSLVPWDDQQMIFGNVNQMDYKVGFDLESGKVSFLPENCSKRRP